MDPQEILQFARAAIQAGKDPEAVNARILELTNGEYATLGELEAGVGEPFRDVEEGDPKTAALRRLNERGGNALSDFLRLAAQGASFGFADELVGLAGGDAEASRQRVEDLRLLNPGSSLAAEAAGGLPLPGFAGTRLAAGVTRGTGSRMIGSTVGAGAAGGGAGALMGFGETEGDVGERLVGSIVPGAAGVAVGGGVGFMGNLASRVADMARGGILRPRGAPNTRAQESARANFLRALKDADIPPGEVQSRISELGPEAVVADLSPNLAREARAAVNRAPGLEASGGPVATLARRAAARGSRTGDELRRATGLPGTFRSSVEEAEEAIEAVRRDFFRPLEVRYPAIDDAAVQASLRNPLIRQVVQKEAPDALRRPPTFRELQDIMLELKDQASAARAAGRPNRSRRTMDAFNQFRETMEERIPGFREAQDAYRVAQARLRAHEMGRKAVSGSRPAREVLDEVASLPPEARNAYRRGMLDAYEVKLGQRETGSGAATGLMAAGDEVLTKLRVLAENDPAFDALLKGLDRETLYSNTWNALKGNSTTAQQSLDVVGQTIQDFAVSKQWVLRRLIAMIGGLTPSEYQQAAKVLGQTLLTDGEQAARLLAQEMALTSHLAGGVGAATGAAAGGSIVR